VRVQRTGIKNLEKSVRERHLGKPWNFCSAGGADVCALILLATGRRTCIRHFLTRGIGSIRKRSLFITVVANIGALLGGILFGTWSERIGRRRAIVIAALLAIPVIPLWAYSHTVVMLALGGFLMQFMVQGAWGVIPAHLNELSPSRCGNVSWIRVSLGKSAFVAQPW